MTKKYIDCEAAFNALLKLIPKVDDDGYCLVIRGDAATAIDSIPAADVRPVVLCRDCIYYHDKIISCFMGLIMDDGTRISGEQYMPPDGFCSFGERRQDGADMRLEPPKEEAT